MKSSKSQSDTPGTNGIRLHSVYKALSSPHTNASKRYLESIASAPSTSIDQLLCKLSSYARKIAPATSIPSTTVEKAASEEWPLHRLLACFEAVLCSMKSRSSQDDLLPLRSFKVCFRLVLDTLATDSKTDDNLVISDTAKAHAAKCWYKLLDHLARLTQRSSGTKVTGLVKAILTDIRSRQVHLHILHWATDVTEKDMSPHLEPATDGRTLLKARSYGLRGLFTQASFFGVDLILHNAYHRLLHQNLFYYFGFAITGGPARTTASGKRRRLGHTIKQASTAQFSLCLASSQLLDALCKVEEDQQYSFESSESRHHLWNNISHSSSTVLARTWTGALVDLLQHTDDNATTGLGHGGMMDKGRPFYYLTTVLVKLRPDNPVYLFLAPSAGSSTLSLGLSTFFAQLVYFIQQPRSGGAKTKIDSPARGKKRHVWSLTMSLMPPFLFSHTCHRAF